MISSFLSPSLQHFSEHPLVERALSMSEIEIFGTACPMIHCALPIMCLLCPNSAPQCCLYCSCVLQAQNQHAAHNALASLEHRTTVHVSSERDTKRHAKIHEGAHRWLQGDFAKLITKLTIMQRQHKNMYRKQ